MFAQANSSIAVTRSSTPTGPSTAEQQPKSLFKMIKNHLRSKTPDHVLSAYKDNAAVMEGSQGGRFFPSPANGEYQYHQERVDILMKVETHNHPTAISPFRVPPPAPAAKSAMRVRQAVAPSPRRAWWASPSPTCASRFRAALGAGLRQAEPHRQCL
ncbi:hypothetical protein [Aeromonas caviae]|uniref:hypothetical protein n=1 Tax=Aeromonas caviae TaxID=648 RepID=UPI003C2D43F7